MSDQRSTDVDQPAETDDAVAATASPTQLPHAEEARPLRPSLLASIAFLAYLFVSLVVWALPVGFDLATRHVGAGGTDVRFYMWAMDWTPHALTNGLDLFRTNLLYAPGGVDLIWTAAVPGPGIVLWPITEAFGPLASVNVAMLLAPASAGWAGFLVCRRVVGAFWPSLIGGYLMGFSSYMVGQMVGHENLVLIFPAILGVYLVIRVVEGSLRWFVFVPLFTLTILFLFACSTELLATASLFGGLAMLGALAAYPEAWRRILRAVLLSGASYGLAALLLLPVLMPAFRESPSEPLRDPEKASVDLYSFVVPRTTMRIGGERFEDVSFQFTAKQGEDGGYVGIGLIAMMIAFAVWGWRHRETWLLLGFVLVVALFSLGPTLHVRGVPGSSLPGGFLTRIPLLQHATPQRFGAYLAVAVGVIAALWLARDEGPLRPIRWGLVLIGALMLLPAVDAPPRGRPIVVPRFFAEGTYREHLEPGEIVFAIPTRKADEMVWEAAADHSFPLAQAYIGAIPEEYLGEGLSKGLALIQPNPYIPPVKVFSRYMSEHRVSVIVSSVRATPKFEELLREGGWEPERVADVFVWRRQGS